VDLGGQATSLTRGQAKPAGRRFARLDGIRFTDNIENA
jgi:hypothetical protein